MREYNAYVVPDYMEIATNKPNQILTLIRHKAIRVFQEIGKSKMLRVEGLGLLPTNLTNIHINQDVNPKAHTGELSGVGFTSRNGGLNGGKDGQLTWKLDLCRCFCCIVNAAAPARCSQGACEGLDLLVQYHDDALHSGLEDLDEGLGL